MINVNTPYLTLTIINCCCKELY